MKKSTLENDIRSFDSEVWKEKKNPEKQTNRKKRRNIFLDFIENKNCRQSEWNRFPQNFEQNLRAVHFVQRSNRIRNQCFRSCSSLFWTSFSSLKNFFFQWQNSNICSWIHELREELSLCIKRRVFPARKLKELCRTIETEKTVLTQVRWTTRSILKSQQLFIFSVREIPNPTEPTTNKYPRKSDQNFSKYQRRNYWSKCKKRRVSPQFSRKKFVFTKHADDSS